MSDIVSAIIETLSSEVCLSDVHLVVAYSGGVDSTALLHALSTQQHLFGTLQAIHVHHGVLNQADVWAAHCQQMASQWQVPCQTIRLKHLVAAMPNLECRMRDARLRVFADWMVSPKHLLLTAHHQEDQICTILKRVATGSGPHGLTGMQTKRPLGHGWLLRPCLALTKQQLTQYATDHQLTWIKDPSNDDTRFERNRIEQILLPQCQHHWPGFASAIATFATKQHDAAKMIATLAKHDRLRYGSQPHQLALPQGKDWHLPRQCYLVDAWLKHHHHIDIPYTTLRHFMTQCQHTKIDRQPKLRVGSQQQLVWYAQHLYLCPTLQSHIKPITWHNMEAPLRLPHGWQLTCQQGNIRPPHPHQTISIRFRYPGQKIKIAGKSHHQTVKKLMSGWRIPPWQRQQIPMLYYDNTCVAIIGYAVCEGFLVSKQQGITVIADPIRTSFNTDHRQVCSQDQD